MREGMGPRIAIIGGGSYQWVPKLVVDLANSPVLQAAEVVIEDIDPAPIPRMIELIDHIADVRGVGMTGRGTTDQRDALEGADYVVVNISTGGFDSMRHDLEIPARYGIEQSVGDSVGPGGIIRAVRNIPVFLELARDMVEICPDAWLLNLTNPMTTICRAVTRESNITTIGLCHEITIMQFMLSLLLDVGFMDISPTVTGVNHLPFITKLDVAGSDGFALLRDLVDSADERAGEPLAMAFPEGLGHEKISEGGEWTKGDVLHHNRLKLELFRRFGVLPGAGDRHVAEFFSGFLTEESGWGARWGFGLTSIEDRERGQQQHIDDFEEMLASPEVSSMPSGEMVAAVIACRMQDAPGWFPLNIPNHGQVSDLPADVVVESMCVVDGAGVRGRDVAALPPVMAEHLRRVSLAQERTVEAGVTGSRGAVLEAMFLDPLAGRIDDGALEQMTDEMLAATKPWLPQFA
jgi:alpha-galactosidase/6-phospho-beta-glucosidase family protein